MSVFWTTGYRDTAGVSHGYINNAGAPQVCAQQYLQALAEGDIAGHVGWVKNGYNGALSNVSEDLWSVGGTYVYPTAAMQMEVVSSSASDASAGVGVQSIRIYYLDGSFAEKETTVTLNGTTPVATSVSNIYRVQNMMTETVGTTGNAVGNIDIRHVDNTPIYGRIQAGQNINKDMIYTVPAGKSLYATNVLVSVAGNVANRPVTITTRVKYSRLSGLVTAFFVDATEVTLTDAAIDIILEMPTYLPAGTDIKISAISPDGATYASVVVRGWIE